jgi:pimeloyl-ACP methyl ester carboxylesterase
VAPWLAGPEQSVVAVDLSGHGDSGHRPLYRLDDWAAEMLAVAEDAEIAGRPVLAGHSLGGWATVVAAAEYPDAVEGLVLMDCRIIDPADVERGAGPPRDRRPFRVYPTMEEALRRYRPEPAQEGTLPYVLDHLAATSIKQVEGGWTWKFDLAALHQQRPGGDALRRVTCPVAILRGERGLVTPAITEAMSEALGGRAPVVDIPLAGHHLMLDQPLSLVTALRTVLAGWSRPLYS